MRTLAEIGEFGLIARIQRLARSQPRGQVVLGIGDDAALIRPRAGEDVVISADSLVENVHFRWNTQSAATIGSRALLVNLSDLAAMGARPLAFTLAMAAPPALPLARADGLLRGLLDVAAKHACPLVGGNLARARETSLAITVLGAVKRGRELRRHTPRAGDLLFVTGSFGSAALALARSEQRGTALRRLPEPRLAAGRALGRLPMRCACIDVSDGLLADLGHLLEGKPGGTALGAEIEPERVPVPRGFAASCAELGLDPESTALRGGEDYELLFALPARSAPSEERLSRRLGVPVRRIGRVSARPGVRGPAAGRGAGWRHF